jgi:hypothetical protein
MTTNNEDPEYILDLLYKHAKALGYIAYPCERPEGRFGEDKCRKCSGCEIRSLLRAHINGAQK